MEIQIVPKLKVYEPATYRIHVHGSLDQSWVDYFGDEEHGVATLTGQVQDQSALLGMLNRLVDMGLPLLLVQYIPIQISENPE